MDVYGSAVPDRARLPGRIITDRNNKIDGRCAAATESVPGLRLEALDSMALATQFVDGARINKARRVTASAECSKLTTAEFINQHFAKNASCRIARAQNEYVHTLENSIPAGRCVSK